MTRKITLVTFACLLFVHCRPVEYVKTLCSEKKEYCLEIYKEKMFFAMPGQGSDHMARIVLIDATGRQLKIVNGNSSPDENIMLRDVEVRWDIENDKVWYGRARFFELD